MPEEEFELYLSLLSRLLHLSPDQRREIADELRDHLEVRCDALVEQGVSRHDAIRSALEELGEAAELAQQFTQIAAIRRRRRLMRWSINSVAVAVGVVIAVFTFWPESSVVVRSDRAEAQGPVAAGNQAKEPGADAKLTLESVTSESVANARAEAKLTKRLDGINFVDTPIGDVLQWISEQTSVDVLIDERSWGDEGLSLDSPVTLEIKHTTPAASTVLELVLEQLGLCYRLRDGIVYTETLVAGEDAQETRVYDCSDLVTAASPVATDSVGLATTEAVSVGESKSYFGKKPVPKTRAGQPHVRGCSIEALMEVLMSSTGGPWSMSEGVGGTITPFGDVLVIRQTQAMHREIAKILDMLRDAQVHED